MVPRTKSAKKAMRQTKTRTERNRAQRSQLRNAVKKVRAAGTADEATKAFEAAQKVLDRAGRKNLSIATPPPGRRAAWPGLWRRWVTRSRET